MKTKTLIDRIFKKKPVELKKLTTTISYMPLKSIERSSINTYAQAKYIRL